jgi:hypothetical protein
VIENGFLNELHTLDKSFVMMVDSFSFIRSENIIKPKQKNTTFLSKFYPAHFDGIIIYPGNPYHEKIFDILTYIVEMTFYPTIMAII